MTRVSTVMMMDKAAGVSVLAKTTEMLPRCLAETHVFNRILSVQHRPRQHVSRIRAVDATERRAWRQAGQGQRQDWRRA